MHTQAKPSDRTDAVALWPLPLVAILLPTAGVIAALQISNQLELIPVCNPLIDGCVSISRAGRHGLANIIFRAAILPAAALQALTWILYSRWLRSHTLPSSWLAPLGVIASVFLVLYGSFLGMEGATYRWLRQYGTIAYFGFSYLCMLLVIVRLRGGIAAICLPRWISTALVSLCALLLLFGLLNTLVAQAFEPVLKDSIENISEWWAAIIFALIFVLLAEVWRRTGASICIVRPPTGARCPDRLK